MAIRCPDCGSFHDVDDKEPGTKFPCSCGREMTVPGGARAPMQGVRQPVAPARPLEPPPSLPSPPVSVVATAAVSPEPAVVVEATPAPEPVAPPAPIASPAPAPPVFHAAEPVATIEPPEADSVWRPTPTPAPAAPPMPVPTPPAFPHEPGPPTGVPTVADRLAGIAGLAGPQQPSSLDIGLPGAAAPVAVPPGFRGVPLPGGGPVTGRPIRASYRKKVRPGPAANPQW